MRGVYADALTTKRADFSRKHEHYNGALDREPLLAALNEKHAALLAALESVDTESPIDFFGTPFTFGGFAYTVIQHERSIMANGASTLCSPDSKRRRAGEWNGDSS